jgi:endonuclease G
MNDFKFLRGYNEKFLNIPVPLPTLNDSQHKDVAAVKGRNDNVADYINYSVVLSASRRFPYFTASNIDGRQFQKAPRKDNWRKDERIAENNQWGPELYKASHSDFDKGHMTKREDVQWGETIAIASKAADSTFFYTNAVPQHAALNQRVWRSLEDYILHTEAKEKDIRISIFTGPVLSKNDPLFVTEVEHQQVHVPVIFYKVVYFLKSDGKLYRVGFLMSQSSLLKKNQIVKEVLIESLQEEDKLLMEFEEADTYQVNVGTIEKLTGLTFPDAVEPFTDNRKVKLILKEIDVKESLNESASVQASIGFSIEGLAL